MDASLYVRVSTAAGTDNLSRDGMVDDLKVLAHQHGYNVTAVRVDDGISGAIRNRPKFQAWLDDARTGNAQALLTWHADRLTREGVNAAALVLDTIEGKDPETGKVVRPPVRLLDTKGADSFGDETAFRFQFVIAAEIARAERNRIRDRNLAAQRRLREKRRFRGGSAPYGYRIVPLDGGGKGLEIDPVEAGHIRAAAEYLLNGHSLYATVRVLNGVGSKPRRAAQWSMPSLRTVLIGDAALGRMTHKGQVIRDDDGMPEQVWEPIFTLDEAQQLRTLLTAPGRKKESKGRRKAARLVSGQITCSGCGKRMRANSSNGVARYICANGFAAGQGCDHPVSAHADKLDAWIEAEFLERYGSMTERKPVITVADNVAVAEVKDAIQSLAQDMTQPGADIPKIAAKMQELSARRDVLEAQGPSEVIQDYIATGRTMAEAWESGDLTARQRLIQWALQGESVTVLPRDPAKSKKVFDPDRYDIPWRPALPKGKEAV